MKGESWRDLPDYGSGLVSICPTITSLIVWYRYSRFVCSLFLFTCFSSLLLLFVALSLCFNLCYPSIISYKSYGSLSRISQYIDFSYFLVSMDLDLPTPNVPFNLWYPCSPNHKSILFNYNTRVINSIIYIPSTISGRSTLYFPTTCFSSSLSTNSFSQN